MGFLALEREGMGDVMFYIEEFPLAWYEDIGLW